MGSKISDVPHSNIFADISPKARKIEEKINKWDYMKLKSFCTGKETIIKMKREPTICDNIKGPAQIMPFFIIKTFYYKIISM